MASITVTATPVQVPGVAGTTSEHLIQNLGPDNVWVGNSDSVTDASGLRLAPGDVLSTADGIAAKNLGPLWLVCAEGETADVRVLRTA